MKLSQLIATVTPAKVKGNVDGEITSLGFDSRRTAPGQLFFALKGEAADGHDFISDVVAKGAVAVVCEHLPASCDKKVCYIEVPDSHYAMGLMAAEFYGHPSQQLKLVGVTGTNGKTTTATLLYRLFRALGYKAGLLSTVVNYVDDKMVKAERTTPDALQIQHLMAEMVKAGCAYCFMEVSSHAVVQHRIAGLAFDGALFSNITHDHLDYHKTFEAYIKAKKMFFDALPASAFALINLDDRNGRTMVQNTKATVKTYSLHTLADFHCRIIENTFEGMQLNLDGVEVWTRFTGRFNAYNMLLIYATARLLGVDKNETLRLLSLMEPVSGRFEVVQGKHNITAIIDYAHTPDALQNVIDTINDIRHDTQRLITVVGCGGNRDKTKRPVMAHIAAAGSDKVVFTSDNPRNEDPNAILDDMYAGLAPDELARAIRITDRREAINTAIHLSRPGDIILIAGKGHETYQEVKGTQTHFDDKEVFLCCITCLNI
ncbi:MAG: UDP-N-acetylmuramoyl-L-alanyl-D-glutamate--2,6-diaminopimelate ligase [Prevotellaceae bacterium]|jgi:UDP-N-acetylmuramoyl-L-alanyl-D-glutamate--2,6-diaminopimelate ligase|nr:UDP-N-acetylmuramoyl-L-alanyl-D-glutamate--2,6-diaminopimelate ligase [Prevotellaceae bacterium]